MSNRKRWLLIIILGVVLSAAGSLVLLRGSSEGGATLSGTEGLPPGEPPPPNPVTATPGPQTVVGPARRTPTPPLAPPAALSSPSPLRLKEGIWAEWRVDVTVPDGTRFGQGAAFTKTWRLANVGSSPWPTSTVLALVGGDPLSAPPEVAVGVVAPGEEIEVRVAMQAPKEEGAAVGKWALKADGYWIPGGSVWVVIDVAGPTIPIREIRGPFELGGHILRDFKYADLMHHAGMEWVKVQARYPQDYDLSEVIATAHANNFKILVSAVGPPEMVTERGYASRVATWTAGMAAAGADAIEVWNEPNLPREWQSGYISPRTYTYLLCTAYTAIKGANPHTLVISAAPAPTGYFEGCTRRGCDDEPWVRTLYDANAARCFDYLGAHHNSGATAPSATWGHPADPGEGHHSWYFLPQTRLYYDIFNEKRQLFYTELGYVTSEGYGWIPDNFSWGGGTSLGMQAQWLAEAAELSIETGMVRAMIIWNVDASCYGECSGGEDPQAGYAIVRPGNVCPACDTLHEVMTSR